MYLDPPQIYYECLRDEKFNKVKAKILKLYVNSLESKVYTNQH